MRGRVGRVLELAGQHRARRLAHDALGPLHIVLRVIRRHRGGRDDHLGAERLEQPHLLLRHLVGHGEDALVALDGCRERQPHARVAARGLHDRAARLEVPRALQRLDHGQADAVLHRTARIEEVGLAVHRRAHAARDAREPDHGRPADRVEDGVVRAAVPLVRVVSGVAAWPWGGVAEVGRASGGRGRRSAQGSVSPGAAAPRGVDSARESAGSRRRARRCASGTEAQPRARTRAPPSRARARRSCPATVVDSRTAAPLALTCNRSITLPWMRWSQADCGIGEGRAFVEHDRQFVGTDSAGNEPLGALTDGAGRLTHAGGAPAPPHRAETRRDGRGERQLARSTEPVRRP
jgi:hypothetical protein